MKYYYSVFRFSFLALLCLAISPVVKAQVIYGVAGQQYNSGYSGDGGMADTAKFNSPISAAVDASGNVYIAEYGNSVIRKVTRATGIITTIAGNGIAGYTGDGGLATSAELNAPTAVALDKAGNIYISDNNNYRIRKIDAITGFISTIAGNGTQGYTGDGGLATSAEISSPYQIAFDTAGNLNFVDQTNTVVRKIDKTTGFISTVAGNGISGYSGDGMPASAAEFVGPTGLAFDKANNMYIADENGQNIRMVKASTDTISTFAGNGTQGYTGDGIPANTTELSYPFNLAVDSIGNIYVTDMYNYLIRKIDTSDIITSIAGSPGNYSEYGTQDHIMATYAILDNPSGLTIDNKGNIYVVDGAASWVREINYNGPSITSQSASNAVLCYGIPGTYFVTATGTGNTYQWMVDSGSGYQPLTNNGTFSGVTTDTLHLTLNTSYSISFNCAINGGYVVSQDIYPNLYNPPYLVPYNPENGPGCPGTMVDINVSDYSIGKIKPKAPSSGTDNFYWSTGDTTFSGYGSDIYVSPSVTTTYTVIADNGGCRADTTITVYVYSRSLKANVFPSNKVCQGSSVTIYEVGSGGSFSWSEMGTANNYYTPTVTFTADSSVRYYLSGNDSSGCSDLDSLTITVNPSPTVTVSSLPLNDSVCKGSAVTLTGSGAVSYNWSGGITNGVGFTPSYSAVYYVTGTDANGCTGTNQANVFVRNLPIISASASPSGAVCQGSSVTLDGNGGVSYSWSSGVTNSVPFIPASSGTYTVTGTDAFGCSNSTTLGITINSLPNIKGNAFPSANLCQGSSVALIGTGGSSYAWSGGVNNGVGFTPSSTITYTVTGVDANGCTNTDSVTVAVNPKVVITTTSNNTTCGLINGSAVAAGSNGTPPYRYSWNNPVSPDSAISNLGPGTYIVTVLDTAGCSSTAAVNIGSSTAPILSVTTIASNCSQATGSAIVSVTGGTTPYRYMWNNGDTLSSNYNLKAATYIVTVTDVNNCSTFAPGIVTNANGPTITSSVTDVACNGMATGAISITVSTGVAPFTYAWSNGATTSSIGNLNAGPYQVTVTDADSCTSIESFTVNQPKNPIALTYTSAKADCSTSDGSASVSVTGGVSPYTYAWSTGATATDITNVSAGVYEVSITDKNGCVDSAHIAVSNKTGPSVSISIAGNANCGNGGIVSVTATGGTSPYTYMWSNGATATDITNIPAGVYTVSVTDKLGCIGTADTTVTEVLPPVIPLCIVTVDPTMNKNVILWDNPIVGSSNISYYNLYKESTKAGVYFKVAQVPYDSLSQFVDTLSNPSVRSWRYELSQVDTCGNESPLSPAHKTMHVTVNEGLGNTINLIWDNYEGLAFSTYYVYRDTNYNNFTLIDSIPNNIFTYTDSHPINTYQPVYYRIGIDYPTGCTAHTKAKTYNASHSNTATTAVLGISNLNIGSDELNIYPNPNNGKFTFELKTTKSEMLRIDIYNMIGEKIYSEDCGKVLGIMTKQMDLSAYSKGVYFVKVVSDNNVYNRRVVVQ